MAEDTPHGEQGRLGHEGVIPYLVVTGAADAIAFYEKAFGAVETMRLPMPDGLLGHAELKIDGRPLYLADMADSTASSPMRSPTAADTTTVVLHRYVQDVDAATRRAQEAGATVLREPADQFYGDRVATVQDPFGHLWTLHTRLRSVSMEDMQQAVQPDS